MKLLIIEDEEELVNSLRVSLNQKGTSAKRVLPLPKALKK